MYIHKFIYLFLLYATIFYYYVFFYIVFYAHSSIKYFGLYNFANVTISRLRVAYARIR